MSIHVCTCTHQGKGYGYGKQEFHLRYPGMSKEAAQNIADKINAGKLDTPDQPDWKSMAFARLGMVRDRMSPEDVETVQRFLDGDYSPRQKIITGWQPIKTAPKDNKRVLYLARFDDFGLVELDYDGTWEYWSESYEMSHINGYDWVSANGIEEPTHWAYQDEPIPPVPKSKLWLWKNFVNDRPEYWAFDNPYPVKLDNDDPQTLGEPCGYALLKPSRPGRPHFDEAEVIEAIKTALPLPK